MFTKTPTVLKSYRHVATKNRSNIILNMLKECFEIKIMLLIDEGINTNVFVT